MSFDIALSGIQAINEQLNTTSNNIANASTYGFKGSRANFSAMYAGSTPVGTQVTSTTQNIGLNGGILNTGRALDASINGRGFFVMKDANGQTNYTRVGIFQKDATDFIIDANGRKVQGYQITPPSTIPGPLGDIKVPTGLIQPEPTTDITFVANLSKDWAVPTGSFAADATADPVVTPDPTSYNYLKSSLVYDSRGTEHTITQYFAKSDDNNVTVYTTLDGTDLGGTVSPITLVFDNDGKLVIPPPPDPQEITNVLEFTPDGANDMEVTITYNGTSFQAGDAVTSTNDSNGYSAGAYVGVELANDGSVIAKYSNGERQRVGYVALATFPNEDGLTASDNTSWIATDTAGTPNYTQPGVGLAGELSVTTLEGSNVDITAELVSLMTSQRNYQANSKVITTENQMLQSLMQAM